MVRHRLRRRCAFINRPHQHSQAAAAQTSITDGVLRFAGIQFVEATIADKIPVQAATYSKTRWRQICRLFIQCVFSAVKSTACNSSWFCASRLTFRCPEKSIETTTFVLLLPSGDITFLILAIKSIRVRMIDNNNEIFVNA